MAPSLTLPDSGAAAPVHMRIRMPERATAPASWTLRQQGAPLEFTGEKAPADEHFGRAVVMIEDTDGLTGTRRYALAPVEAWLTMAQVDVRDKSALEQVELAERFQAVGDRPSAALKTLSRLRGEDGEPDVVDLSRVNRPRDADGETTVAGGRADRRRGVDALGHGADGRRVDAEDAVESVLAAIDPEGEDAGGTGGQGDVGRDLLSRFAADMQHDAHGPGASRTFDVLGSDPGGVGETGIDFSTSFGDDAGDGVDAWEGEGDAADYGITRTEREEGDAAFQEQDAVDEDEWVEGEGVEDDTLQKELGEAPDEANAPDTAAGTKRRHTETPAATAAAPDAASMDADAAFQKRPRLDPARFASDPTADIRTRIRELFTAYGGPINMTAVSKEFRTELSAPQGRDAFRKLLVDVVKAMCRQIVGADGGKEFVLKE